LWLDLKNKDIVVGSVDDTPASNFHIRSKPKIGTDIVNSSGSVVSEFITKIDITGGGNNATVFQIYKNGSSSPSETKTVSIQGSVQNATNATYAQKIGSSSTNTGSAYKPVYVSNGVVTAMNPTSNIGTSTTPIYFDKTNGFAACNGIEMNTGTIRAKTIVAGDWSSLAGKLLTIGTGNALKAHPAVGLSTQPIYIKDDGTADTCKNIYLTGTTTSLDGFSAGTKSVGDTLDNISGDSFASGGVYLVRCVRSGSVYMSFIISIDKSSGVTNYSAMSSNCSLRYVGG